MHTQIPHLARRFASAVRRRTRGARLLVALGLLAPAWAPLAAQSDSATARRPEPLFTGRDAAILGGLTVLGAAVSLADRRIAHGLQDSSLQADDGLQSFAKGARRVNERSLFALEVAAWGVSRLAGADRAADVSLHAAEAVLVSSVAATLVRGVLGRSRPFVTDGDDPYDFKPFKGVSGSSASQAYRAFPSIHASAGVATAVVLTEELRLGHPQAARIVGPALLLASVTPAVARMYGNKHWASDVVVGAGLGWWTGRKVVRYHHSRDRTRTDRWLLGAKGEAVTVTFRF